MKRDQFVEAAEFNGFLRLEIRDTDHTRPRISPLPRHLLRRVLDRMQLPDAELSLQGLAAEAGYSRAHFLRMFHAATGLTPHRYILQLRVSRARGLLGRRGMPLIDIAAECGFSSQAHLSRVFRQLQGITPSQYRDGLRFQ